MPRISSEAGTDESCAGAEAFRLLGLRVIFSLRFSRFPNDKQQIFILKFEYGNVTSSVYTERQNVRNKQKSVPSYFIWSRFTFIQTTSWHK
jgi:hypothetical protein